MKVLRSTTLAAAGVAVILAVGCGSRQEPPAAPAKAEHLPATFDEAKRLAAERGTPLLVDFYSPT